MANPRKIKAEVVSIENYGSGVYRLILKSDSKIPKCRAGQFLHLAVDEYDPSLGYWPESRVFSICSNSRGRNEISFVYSVKGSYTRKMEETLTPGSQVWIKLPYGEFVISDYMEKEQTAILIAAGTGISPYIPFLSESGDKYNVKLFYGLRNSGLVIFEEELKEALQYRNVTLDMTFEEKDNSVSFQGNFKKKMGTKLSIDDIMLDIQDLGRSVFFISGPPVMITNFKKALLSSGISKEKIVIDEWD